MAEPKPFASLSAGLLASKGGARPAMRRQMQIPNEAHEGHDDLGWNDMGYDVNPQDNAHDLGMSVSRGLSPMAVAVNNAQRSHQDDIDAAVESAIVQPLNDNVELCEPTAPEVHAQQKALEQAMAPAAIPSAPVRQNIKSVAPRARAGSRGNFAFTLRLDPERHLRLRLASAASNQSTQQIMIALVDNYLADLPEIDAFAAQLPAPKRSDHH
ncbi:MAG: hypothetical protein ABL909_07920 [Sphingopyxis sp.]